jgi:hypothetical protein
VSQSRTTKARIDLFSHSCAAYDLAALEHKRMQARLCEIAAGDESVVPAADDYDIASFSHRDLF